jgi:hypothetical protein
LNDDCSLLQIDKVTIEELFLATLLLHKSFIMRSHLTAQSIPFFKFTIRVALAIATILPSATIAATQHESRVIQGWAEFIYLM